MSTLKVYLAGASREAHRVRYVASRLTISSADLVEFTFKWWEPGAYGPPEQWTGQDASIDLENQRFLANSNIGGIDAAELFLCLWPEDSKRSTSEAELGYALSRADELEIVVSGRAALGCMFTSLAGLRTESDEEAIAHVLKVAEGVRGW